MFSPFFPLTFILKLHSSSNIWKFLISFHGSWKIELGWLFNHASYVDCSSFFGPGIKANSHFLVTLHYAFYKLLVAWGLLFSLLVFKLDGSTPSEPSLGDSRFCWLFWLRWCLVRHVPLHQFAWRGSAAPRGFSQEKQTRSLTPAQCAAPLCIPTFEGQKEKGSVKHIRRPQHFGRLQKIFVVLLKSRRAALVCWLSITALLIHGTSTLTICAKFTSLNDCKTLS